MNRAKNETTPVESSRQRASGLGRRDLMKLGAGVLATALNAPKAGAQGPAPVPNTLPEKSLTVLTRSGYKNTANRLYGNDHMDDTTRKIVSWAHSFSEANLTEPLVRALNRTMVDSMAALISGFEEDSVRVAARMAKLAPQNDSSPEKSTVLGYGLTTSPELAAFVNSCLVRNTDFNDHGPAGHASDLIPGVLAVAEAMHATGTQVLLAITVGYECRAAGGIGEQGSAALAAAKVMGLDEDRLANALSLGLTPHVPLSKGEGHLSMWKGCRSAEAVKNGVWGALLAREGMTGPPAPFEGVGARWALFGRGEVLLPRIPGKLAVERQGVKRTPTEASSQAALELIPDMRAWTKVEDIASIHYRMSFGNWTEIADNPKFDPKNRETADHSMPYILARALMDGEIYLDSFTEAKYMDPVARALMAKMTFAPVADWDGNGPARITIRKKNGEERSWDTKGGRRTRYVDEAKMDGSDAFNTPMSDADITNKFNRVCAYKQVTDAQRDRARAVWGNLRAVKDIGEAIQTLAKFGNPKPL